MDVKLELVIIPVTDVDRAKAFYVDQVGFVADHDHVVTESLRFVQLTPPGSTCSISFGLGITRTGSDLCHRANRRGRVHRRLSAVVGNPPPGLCIPVTCVRSASTIDGNRAMSARGLTFLSLLVAMRAETTGIRMVDTATPRPGPISPC